MAVDMNEVIAAEQARILTAQGNANTAQMDLQAKQYLSQLTSVDLVEAAAAKELSKAGVSTDLAAMRTVRIVPSPDSGA